MFVFTGVTVIMCVRIRVMLYVRVCNVCYMLDFCKPLPKCPQVLKERKRVLRRFPFASRDASLEANQGVSSRRN
ncbi:hypothetical protein Hanom_Chr06g00503691 [Helianthus anomalus]